MNNGCPVNLEPKNRCYAFALLFLASPYEASASPAKDCDSHHPGLLATELLSGPPENCFIIPKHHGDCTY